MHPSEPFPHFVDDYLAYLHEVLPSQASLDGVHLHDDLLEDFEPAGHRRARPRAGGFGRRLNQIDPSLLPASNRSSTPIVAANVEARMHELETVRTWERNPQMYADTLGTSLAGQALFAYAPEAERARRVVSKLRQVPRLVQAARDNIKECPGHLRQDRPRNLARRALKFIENDLPRAFSSLDDLHILGDLADTSTEAAHAIPAYVDYLETDLAPRAKASFRLGREQLRAEAEARRGHLAQRRPAADDRPARAAGGAGGVPDGRRPAERRRSAGGLAAAKEQHPAAGHARRHGARRRWRSSRSSCSGSRSCRCPTSEPVVVAPSPEFYRWAFASMWTPGPFESKPSRAYYYLTDVDRGWPPERQKEHLRDFNLPTLWNISIHEVYPGHFLHSQHLRQVESKVRKSTLLRAGVVRRGLGALLRAHDGGSRLPQAATPPSGSASSPKRWCGWRGSSSASGCTARTCRWSRACASSATRRSSKRRPRGAKPSAARSIRPTSSTRPAS